MNFNTLTWVNYWWVQLYTFHNSLFHINDLKEQFHDDFAALNQFFAKIITLRL